MPLAIPTAMLIAGAVSTGAQVAGNVMSNRSQSKAHDKQLAAEKYQVDQQAQMLKQQQQEEQRRYNLEAEARKPYEAMRIAALQGLAKGYGVNLPSLASLGGGGGQMAASQGQPQMQGQAPTLASLGQPQQMGMQAQPLARPQAPQFAQMPAPRTLAELAQLTQMYGPQGQGGGFNGTGAYA